MTNFDSLRSDPRQATAGAGSSVSDLQAFINTRHAFSELEASGVSEFQIFNALADLYHQRGNPEVSALMAEAAYTIYQKM